MNWNNYISNWKKYLGFRNLRDKLEKGLSYLDKRVPSRETSTPSTLSLDCQGGKVNKQPAAARWCQTWENQPQKCPDPAKKVVRIMIEYQTIPPPTI